VPAGLSSGTADSILFLARNRPGPGTCSAMAACPFRIGDTTIYNNRVLVKGEATVLKNRTWAGNGGNRPPDVSAVPRRARSSLS
jgi:hypothetical protein